MKPADRSSPEPLELDVRLRNEREAITRLEQALLEAVSRFGYPEASRFALRLALEEAVINAFRHGHRHLPDTPIRVRLDVDDKRAAILVEDQGPGFDPGSVPDPTLDENLEIPTGRGLMLMRAYMTDVRYEGRGNIVRMVYERSGEDRRPRQG